jgi:XTP/dITP diphosphohydrolase
MKPTLCFATNNPHKLQEVAAVVGNQFNLKSLAEIGSIAELPETGDTLQANALQKAQYVFDHFKVDCFADDTGLEVTALNGAPGVYSARYASMHSAGQAGDSEANMNLLLKNLQQHNNLAAQFRTVICLLQKGQQPRYFEGIVKGEILQQRQGEKGFGYDPIFMPEGYRQSFAQMPAEEKNRISHRGRAVQMLAEYLKEL